MMEKEYKDLNKFSKSIGIPTDRLVKAFEIEKDFHYKVLNESSQEERKKLYAEVYTTVHKIYGKTENDINVSPNPKENIVKLFKKELESKSILDVGCGEGYFLAGVSKNLKTKKLTGIDISIPESSLKRKDINFIKSDIIDFNLNEKFDVIIADQVVEHIAPADLSSFLNSINNSLLENGILILLLPNGLFGPSDVTRIIDFSYSGKVKAEGTHLNESTYNELIPKLTEFGFTNFKTVLHLPKLKYIFTNFRMNSNIMRFIENNKVIMNLIYKIKFKGFPLFRFETVLICSKK